MYEFAEEFGGATHPLDVTDLKNDCHDIYTYGGDRIMEH
jgi:hypothetical protein